MDIEQTCEALWKRIAVGTPERSLDQARENDGYYVKGHRNDTETWTLAIDDLKLRATRVDWQNFNLAADDSGIRRIVEVLSADQLLFRADQNGATTRVKFVGADERHVGTDENPAEPWRITHGTLSLIEWIEPD
jgi:hypothetical protein